MPDFTVVVVADVIFRNLTLSERPALMCVTMFKPSEVLGCAGHGASRDR